MTRDVEADGRSEAQRMQKMLKDFSVAFRNVFVHRTENEKK